MEAGSYSKTSPGAVGVEMHPSAARRTPHFGWTRGRGQAKTKVVSSIVESLKKLVDPLRAREEERQRRADRERPDADDDGGPPPPKRRCRVCGHEGPEPRFCPDCLAETMRPL